MRTTITWARLLSPIAWGLLALLSVHLAIWAFDLQWGYRLEVALETDSIGIRDNCWPTLQTRWASPTGESFDQCWEKVDSLDATAAQLADSEPYTDEWMEPFLALVQHVGEHGDEQSRERLFIALCPLCRASYSEKTPSINDATDP